MSVIGKKDYSSSSGSLQFIERVLDCRSFNFSDLHLGPNDRGLGDFTSHRNMIWDNRWFPLAMTLKLLMNETTPCRSGPVETTLWNELKSPGFGVRQPGFRKH